MHYIGLDVHKQSVSYCTKTAGLFGGGLIRWLF